MSRNNKLSNINTSQDSLYAVQLPFPSSKLQNPKIQNLSLLKKKEGVKTLPFFNRSFDKKRLKLLFSWYYANKGENAAFSLVETLQKLGFTYAMKAGISLGVDDLKVPSNKIESLTEAVEFLNNTKAAVESGNVTALEEFQQFVDTWHRTSENLKTSVIKNFTRGVSKKKPLTTSLKHSKIKYPQIKSSPSQSSSTNDKTLVSFSIWNKSSQVKLSSLKSRKKKDVNSTTFDIPILPQHLGFPPLQDLVRSSKPSASQNQDLASAKPSVARHQKMSKLSAPLGQDLGEQKKPFELSENPFGQKTEVYNEAKTFPRGEDFSYVSSQKYKPLLRSFGNTLNPVYMMAFSGARGNLSQVRQLVGMRGLMADPQGQLVEFPIQSNFREGLTVTEYMISCYGARKGLVDTALRTAAAGYLTRRLVDVSHHQIVRSVTCGTKSGIRLPLYVKKQGLEKLSKSALTTKTKEVKSLAFCIGRVLARDIPGVAFRNQEIDISLGSSQPFREVYEKVGIYIRSPLTCKSEVGLCQLCYGWSVSANRLVGLGEAVGIIAAQSIGEPGTQLTMRTFHTGGVFSGDIMEECRSKHEGIVCFQGAYLGLMVRTAGGAIAFCIKTTGIMHVKGLEKLTTYTLLPNTLLFVRQGEKVGVATLLAQIPNLPEIEESTGESTKTIVASLSGEVRQTPTVNIELENIRILAGQENGSFFCSDVPTVEPKDYERSFSAKMRLIRGSHRLGNHTRTYKKTNILPITSPNNYKLIYNKNFGNVANREVGTQETITFANSFSKNLSSNTTISLGPSRLQRGLATQNSRFVAFGQVAKRDLATQGPLAQVQEVIQKNQPYQFPFVLSGQTRPSADEAFNSIKYSQSLTENLLFSKITKLLAKNDLRTGILMQLRNLRVLKKQKTKPKSLSLTKTESYSIKGSNYFKKPKFSRTQVLQKSEGGSYEELGLGPCYARVSVPSQGLAREGPKVQKSVLVTPSKPQRDHVQAQTTASSAIASFLGQHHASQGNLKHLNIRSLIKTLPKPKINKIKFLQHKNVLLQLNNKAALDSGLGSKTQAQHNFSLSQRSLTSLEPPRSWLGPFRSVAFGQVVKQALAKQGPLGQEKPLATLDNALSQKKKNQQVWQNNDSLAVSLKKSKVAEPKPGFSDSDSDKSTKSVRSLAFVGKAKSKDITTRNKNKEYITFRHAPQTLLGFFCSCVAGQISVNLQKPVQINTLFLYREFFFHQYSGIGLFRPQRGPASSCEARPTTLSEPKPLLLYKLKKTISFAAQKALCNERESLVVRNVRANQLKTKLKAENPFVQLLLKSFNNKKFNKANTSLFEPKKLSYFLWWPLNMQDSSFEKQKVIFYTLTGMLKTIRLTKTIKLANYSYLFWKLSYIIFIKSLRVKKQKQFFLKKRISINLQWWGITRQSVFYSLIDKKSKKSSKPNAFFPKYLSSSLNKTRNSYFAKVIVFGPKGLASLGASRSVAFSQAADHALGPKGHAQVQRTQNQEQNFFGVKALDSSYEAWPSIFNSAVQGIDFLALSQKSGEVFPIQGNTSLKHFKKSYTSWSKESSIVEVKSKARIQKPNILRSKKHLILTHYDRVSYNLINKHFIASFDKSRFNLEQTSDFYQAQSLLDLPSMSNIFKIQTKLLGLGQKPLHSKVLRSKKTRILRSKAVAPKEPRRATCAQPQIGYCINIGDELINNYGSSHCGQIIEKSYYQLTLRFTQNVLYSNLRNRQAVVSKYVKDGNWLCKGTSLVTLPYITSVTGDIVAGIPKIEQLFEARGETLEKTIDKIWFSYKTTVVPRAKAVRECFKEIGLFVVAAIQKVYSSQGVKIADKHLEVIIRQMIGRALILDPGDTPFLPDEFVDLQTIERVNWTTYGERASYRPHLVGITKTSLTSNSFLSSASFQQTARVLERETFLEKTDRLLGLKERVMMGALINAGTGDEKTGVVLSKANKTIVRKN